MYSLWLSARMSVVFVATTLQQFLHPDDARDSDVFLYEDEAEAADAPSNEGRVKMTDVSKVARAVVRLEFPDQGLP